MIAMSSEAAPQESDRWRARHEHVVVVLLSVTTILTAWSAFEASKWGGAMSIAFSEASSSRIAAGRLEADANRRLSVQTGLFTQWLQAYQADDQELADFLEERFPEPLATAFPVWLESEPLKNPDAAGTPFELEEYAIPELEEAAAADARADQRFQLALRNNQRGDNYTVLTIGFAAILFFGALAGRMRDPRLQWVLLGLGWVGFVVLSALLLSFPKLV